MKVQRIKYEASRGRAVAPEDDAVAASPPAASEPAVAPPAAPGRLVLIGTGHVFRIRDTITAAIEALHPDIVFVELDQGRLNALLHRERTGEMPPGKAGFVQGKLQKFQHDVAKAYGAEVGGEMIAAVQAGQAIGARVALIDRMGQATIKKAIKNLTWKEKGRAVGQFVKASVAQLFPRKRADLEDELQKYQDDPAAALEELKRQYPTVWSVVIDERDEHMARAIRHGLQNARLGVAVVGDGHVGGILARLSDLDVTAYRLPEVRAGALPKPAPAPTHGSGPSDVSFGYDLQW